MISGMKARSQVRTSMGSGRGYLLVCALIAAGTAAGSAHAQHHHFHGGPAWHGDIHYFHEHDWPIWHAGHWYHGRHSGQLGWWWIAGGAWYFYPAPVYPYPNPYEPPYVVVAPPTAAIPPAPPAQYWYYCQPAKQYYPYVATCPSGWTQVPATPADTAAPHP